MGQTESNESRDFNGQKLEWISLFSPKVIEYVKHELEQQEMKKSDSIDSVPLCTLLENLLSLQRSDYGSNLPNDLSDYFFKPIIKDIDVHYDQARNFVKYFDVIRSKASSIFERENLKKQENLEHLFTKFSNISQPKKVSTSFLEDFVSIALNDLLPHIDLLDEDEIVGHLNKLNSILENEKPQALSFISSSAISTIHIFITQLGKIDKFKVLNIQKEIIKFLYNMSYVQGNILGYLSAFVYMIALPNDFDITFNTCILDSYISRQKFIKSNYFSVEIPDLEKLISFSIGSNVLILAKNNKLLVFNNPEVYIINVEVSDDSFLLDANDFIYIFSQSTNSIQTINVNDLEEQMKNNPAPKGDENSSKVLPILNLNLNIIEKWELSKLLNISYKIISVGHINKNIITVQETKVGQILFSIFDENIYDNMKISNPTKDSQLLDIAYELWNVYFDETSIHLIDTKRYDHILEFQSNCGKFVEKTKNFCLLKLTQGSPHLFYKGFLYSIVLNRNTIFFTKHEINNQSIQNSFPIEVSPIILPSLGNTNFKESIIEICNGLTLIIDSLMQRCFQNVFSISNRNISFFVSGDFSSIKLSINLLQSVIDTTTISNDIKVALISLGIKIIALNVFVYCIKFSKGIENYTDQDKELFSDINNIIQTVSLSKSSRHSPEILESVCILYYFSFRYLYYPDYKGFSSFILNILEDDILCHFFITNFSFLSKSPCFFYLFNERMFLIIRNILSPSEIYSIFDNSLDQLTEELQFLSENSIKANEEFIVPYFESLIKFMYDNFIEFDKILPLLQKFVFRLMNFDTFPLISSSIVSNSIDLIFLIYEKYHIDENFVKSDDENSRIDKFKYDIEEMTQVVESEHNYVDDTSSVQIVDFHGCTDILVEFDPRCNTEEDADFLSIYNKDDQLIKKYSGNKWPKSEKFPYNFLKFKFESDHTVNYWGYRVICSAKVTKESREFNPDPTLFFFNLFCNTLGRLTNIALKSIPLSRKENECKLILQSDLLQGMDKLMINDIPKHNVIQPTKSHVNRSLSRGISRGISFDATNVGYQYPDEMKKGFLNDLISPTPMENGWASKLLQFMYKAVKNTHRIKPTKEILDIEKYAIAALMKQLGFLNVAISFAMSLGTNDVNAQSVPPNLHITWKVIYKLRTILFMSYQKSKSEEQTSTKVFKSLKDDYPAFINEVKTKCQLLLYNDPILKKRFGESEVYDSKTIETTIYELLSFITSDLLIENLSKMVDIRTRRINTRLSGVDSLIKIIDNRKLFKTSQLAYLDPLDRSLAILNDITDVKSVKATILSELFSKFSNLFELLISRVTDKNESVLHRLLFLKIIAVNILGIVDSSCLTNCFIKVSEFVETCQTTPIELSVTLRCIWRLLGIWSIQFPENSIIQTLLHFTNSNNEDCQQSALTILAVLTQKGDYLIPSYSMINKCFESKSPRVIISTLICLSKTLVVKEIDIQDKLEEQVFATIRGKHYNFNGFLHLLLRAAGSALCGGPSFLISDDSLPESHKMLAEEIISFFRIIIKPFSKAHEIVSNTFHAVFNNCSDFSSSNNEELIAVFAILGKETVSYHSLGFVVNHTKATSELSRINIFEKYSETLSLFTNNSSEQTSDNLYKIVPSARVVANPKDFQINDDEAKLINSLQKTIIEYFDKFQSIEFAVLSANFMGFLTVALQNIDNMTTFIYNVELERFFTFSLHLSTNRKIYTIGNLLDRIGSMTTDISSLTEQLEEEPSPMNYSLVFKYETPRYFIPLTFGELLPNNIISSVSGYNCLFVGDRPLPKSSLFYFEIQILKHTNNKFMVGFIDEQSLTNKILFYGLDMKNNVQISPFIHPKPYDFITIENGDYIGCGYTRNEIMFFKNGQNLRKSLPYPLIDNFVPAIITNDCFLQFQFNFGVSMFQTDIVQYNDFDIKSDCLEQADVPVPLKQIQLPTSNEINLNDPNCVEYDKFIQDGEAIWEVPRSHTNELRYFPQPSSNSNTISSPPQSVFSYQPQNISPNSLFIGQPVLIARRILSKDETNGASFSQLSNEAQLYINKIGIIVNIATLPDQPYFNLEVEIFDPILHKKARFFIDSRFIDPIPTPFLKVVESSFKIFQKERLKCITQSFFKRQRSRLYNASHYLIIRMSRILFLIILDYYRYQFKVSELFSKKNAVDVFSLAIMEVFKFKHTPKCSDKWSVIRLSDFIFGEKDQQSPFDIIYTCPCNTHSFSRLIRAVFYTAPNDMQPVVTILLKKSLEHIKNAPFSTRDQIFNIIPNRFIIETPHPMPQTDLNITLTMPPLSTGFLPVLHPLNATQDRILKIDDHKIKDAVSDCTVFSAKECKISFKNPSLADSYGLKVGIFVLNLYLQEYIFKSPLGGIHILSTLLSVVLSSQSLFQDVTKMLKQEMIPGIAELMNKNDFFLDLFAFDFIAPILTTFRWEADDITPRIESAFHSFTSNFQTTISEWTKLAMNSQQAIIMAVFTRLLTLDAAAVRITADSPPEEIGHLYDIYISTKTNKDSLVFEKMIEAISLCVALGFDMPISIRFPAFLIAESWAESIPYTISLESKAGETTISSDIKQFSKGTVHFLNPETDFPPNTALSIQCGQTSYSILPGKTENITIPFSAKLINVQTNEQITTIGDNQIKLLLKGYPESDEAKREKFVSNYGTFKQHAQFMSQHWEVKMDESLCRIAKAIPNIYLQCPLVTDHPMFGTETILNNIPAQLLRCRLQLFKQLDHYVSNIVNIVEFGNQESLLGSIFTSCRAAISTQFKMKTVEKVVMCDLSSSSCVDIHFNRFKASLFHSNPDNPSGQSLLSQFIQQVQISSLPKLKRQNVPWHVDLIGEGATDVGGPGRDLFTEVCMELMNPSIGLFIMNPNKRVNNPNTNQELLIPNPTPLTSQTEREYFYAGVLISLCYVSKLPEPFKFARFVWNYLTNRPVVIDDIYAVDLQFMQLMTSIENSEKTITSPDQFATIFPLFFQVQNSLGEMVELIPGGSTIPVTFERRNEYVQRCKNFRVKEFNSQLEQLRKGFNLIFPPSAASILAPWELELLICGDNSCPVNELKKHCSFNSDESHIEMLWSVLEEFTPEERMLFIKFGCGRMGLPPPGMSWSQKLSIQFRGINDKPDPMKPLPTAATCSSQMMIPRYDSKEWMAKKIRTAITLGADIDQDRNANIHELQDFT